nr:hypothetical protein [Tanacetum cinerariifolium]
MIPEPGDPNREVLVNETFHVQTDDELTEQELKQIEADDQAIQTILLGSSGPRRFFRYTMFLYSCYLCYFVSLYPFTEHYAQPYFFHVLIRQRGVTLPEDIYAAVDSCKTAQEIWLRVQQMMKGSDIGIQEKKAKGVGHFARNNTVRPRRRDAAYLQTQLLIAQKEEARIQLQAEEFDLMADAADLDEIEEVNANCILMANLQQAWTSGSQTDKDPVYDLDGSAEVHDYENCYDNEIINMFTQEEQYTKLLEPIPESHQVPQNDNHVISEVTCVEQSGGTVGQHSANVEETRTLYDSLYHNLAVEVEKVNTVNRKLKETNAELTTELARFKYQEKFFEISQEKYDKLKRCYEKSLYQEQYLSKKINALHLSFGKQIMTLNEKISDLNKQLSKEKSTVSFLLKEKKKLMSDFKIREDELLNKQIQLEKKIMELDNILVKTGQSIQTIYMLSPKPDSFYLTE